MSEHPSSAAEASAAVTSRDADAESPSAGLASPEDTGGKDAGAESTTAGYTPTDGAGEPEEGEPGEERNETLLEQMGGLSGLVYSSVPVLVFVAVYLPTRVLEAAIWSAVGSAVLILIWRLLRREKVQPAISGVLGVAVAAFISYKTGSARGYFLYGIWVSLLFGGAFAVSMVVRWPLAGVVWSTLNGTGMGWRSDKVSRRYYDVATVVWVLVFGARFVVQRWLYAEHAVGWLGAARIGMGWPLTGVAALVTIWAVHKADQRHHLLAESLAESSVTETEVTATGGTGTTEPTSTAGTTEG